MVNCSLSHACNPPNYHVTDLKLLVRVLVLPDSFEQLLAGYRHNAFVGSIPDHGVAFTGTCLAVCEECSIIALPCIVQDPLSEVAVHTPL